MRDGTLIRANVAARLFGIRLLTLEARVVLAPAEVEDQPAALSPRRGPEGEPRPIGTGLALATRTLDEGAASLAAARNGTTGA